MKEFIIKHPFISLLALDVVVCGIENIVMMITSKKIKEEE